MLNRLSFIRNLTFQKTLLVYSILIGIIPVLLIGLLSSYISTKGIQEEVDQGQQIILKQIEYQVDAFLKDLQTTSFQMADDRTFEKALRYGISMNNLEPTLDMVNAISKYRNHSKISFSVSLVNPSYEQVYSNLYGLQEIKDFIYYDLIRDNDGKQRGTQLIPPHTYPNQPELLLLRTIYLNALPSDGVLVMHIDAKQLNEWFQSVNQGGNRKALVVDEQGRIVLSGDQAEVGTRLSPTSGLYRYWLEGEEAASSFVLERVSYQLSSKKSSFNGWTYMSMIPLKELSRKADRIQYMTWCFVAGIAAIWMLIAFLGSRKLTVPLQRITKKMTKEMTGSGTEFQVLDQYMDQIVEMNADLTNRLNEQLPQLKDSVLLQLLRGELKEEEINAKLTQAGLQLQGQRFHVCIVEIEQYGDFIQTYGERDRALFMYALSKMIAEIGGEKFSCLTVAAHPGQVALIVGMEGSDNNEMDNEDGKSGEQTLLEVCESIDEKVKLYFKFSTAIAMSQACRRYSSICEGYQEALRLLHYRPMIDKHKTITYKEITNAALSQQSSRLFVKWQKSIVVNIAEGNFDQAAVEMNKMIDVIPEHVLNNASALGIFNYLLAEIEHLLLEMGYELSDCLDEPIYQTLYACESLQEVREWLIGTVLPAIRNHLAEVNKYDNKKLTRQVIHYIHEHIEDDLSLQKVADEFELTTAKVRALFKEELNMNFITYLIECRISKAKEWLVHSEMPVKDISERLGYTSPQNFSRVFKQMTGVSPGTYRDQFFQKE
ncbi:AraC family transcriptional regulator [Paenibacillus eucommiae]|uniref:AraC-like DNA-binding protein n=1 Tax=Paenibacillus eucommiae TaxID=1355755 RepID=A0ABS4INX5_9BACL|nr:AraC family transcriptional regulator [Paenibacillus eucommiae]MBP1988631.1 AraC-like DNA-binding protein [Paenibacillus eucommiae]